MSGTRIGAGLSTEPNTEVALAAAAGAAREQLGRGDVDLAVVFASRSHLDEIDQRARGCRGPARSPENLIGCCAQGVVGPGHEIEQGAGATVWAAALPGAGVESFHLVASPVDEGVAIEGMPGWRSPDGWSPDMALLLSDPLTFPADALLDVLSRSSTRACRSSAGSRAVRRRSGTASCSSAASRSSRVRSVCCSTASTSCPASRRELLRSGRRWSSRRPRET